MIYTVLHPGDDSATTTVFYSTETTLAAAIAACKGIPGAMVEAPNKPTGTIIVYSVPLDDVAAKAAQVAAAEALLPEGYEVIAQVPAT